MSSTHNKNFNESLEQTELKSRDASTRDTRQTFNDSLTADRAPILSQIQSGVNLKSSLEMASFDAPKHAPDLVCLSHLRWDFVYQRPQHLLTRCASGRRVFFIEEPHFHENIEPHLKVSQRDGGVWVVVPFLPCGYPGDQVENALKALVDDVFVERGIRDYILWYYTPMAWGFSSHLAPLVTVYDCMDELSAFKFAPPELKFREAELMRKADLIFTGGQSLFEAKRDSHPSVFAFPSSVDVPHFAQARGDILEPEDQKHIAGPRIGFFGVVDERMDLDLLSQMADARPEWNFVIIGPVVKIDPARLPRQNNIHYLGGKSYKELPAYLKGWDIAVLPFAKNESTEFISPTKTPEYLAAGKPVISTSIRDVVRPYGDKGFVKIADSAEAFIAAAEEIFAGVAHREVWLEKVDKFLAYNSWDQTWANMLELIESKLSYKSKSSVKSRSTVSAH